PPVQVGLGIVGVAAVAVDAQIFAEPAGDLSHVVGVGCQVVIRQAIGIGVPLAKDPVLGLGRLADEPAAGLVVLEVILIAMDAGGEMGRILTGILPGALDVAFVAPADVALKPVLDLAAQGALGMVGQELLGPLDQVAIVGAGEPLGADEVVDEG